jgi:hypothetical protein
MNERTPSGHTPDPPDPHDSRQPPMPEPLTPDLPPAVQAPDPDIPPGHSDAASRHGSAEEDASSEPPD